MADLFVTKIIWVKFDVTFSVKQKKHVNDGLPTASSKYSVSLSLFVFREFSKLA